MATKSQIQSYLTRPQIKAALDTIAWAEGAGYNTLFGGGTFNDYSRHPNRCIPYRDTCSTAAGRYQFLKGTWDSLGLSDFSPANQDIGAVMLIDRRGALDEVLAGNFQGAVTSSALGKEWASFPYSPYGQTIRTLAGVMNYYNSALAVYGGSATPLDGYVHNAGNLATVDINGGGDDSDSSAFLVLALIGLAFLI